MRARDNAGYSNTSRPRKGTRVIPCFTKAFNQYVLSIAFVLSFLNISVKIITGSHTFHSLFILSYLNTKSRSAINYKYKEKYMNILAELEIILADIACLPRDRALGKDANCAGIPLIFLNDVILELIFT